MIEPRSFFLVAVLALGCAAGRPHDQPVFAEQPRGSPLRFHYVLADGKGILAAETLRGQPTVIIVVTTFDLASQAQARFVSGVLRRHPGRLNAAAVVLEPMENRPLILAFRDALKLEYPVALGDDSLIGGGGPFGDVRAVPSTIVLDSETRLVWKHVGLAQEDDIESALRGL